MDSSKKRLSLYVVSFIIFFITIISVHNITVDNRFNPPVKSSKENAIFVSENNSSINYISMKISRTKVFEVFMNRDHLPQFLKKSEDYFIFHKIIKFTEKVIEIRLSYSILQRYVERILLI